MFHVKHSAILFTDAEAAENGIKDIHLHGRAQDLPETIRRLREALGVLRALPESGDAPMADLRAAAEGLGLGAAHSGSSFLARQIAEAQEDDAHWGVVSGAADFLMAEDDDAECPVDMLYDDEDDTSDLRTNGQLRP